MSLWWLHLSASQPSCLLGCCWGTRRCHLAACSPPALGSTAVCLWLCVVLAVPIRIWLWSLCWALLGSRYALGTCSVLPTASFPSLLWGAVPRCCPTLAVWSWCRVNLLKAVIIWAVLCRFQVGAPRCVAGRWFGAVRKHWSSDGPESGCWWEVQKCWHTGRRTAELLSVWLLRGAGGSSSPLVQHLWDAPGQLCLVTLEDSTWGLCGKHRWVQGWLPGCTAWNARVLCTWGNPFFSQPGTWSKEEESTWWMCVFDSVVTEHQSRENLNL